MHSTCVITHYTRNLNIAAYLAINFSFLLLLFHYFSYFVTFAKDHNNLYFYYYFFRLHFICKRFDLHLMGGTVFDFIIIELQYYMNSRTRTALDAV